MLDLCEGKGHAGGAGVAALFVTILAIRCGGPFIADTWTGADASPEAAREGEVTEATDGPREEVPDPNVDPACPMYPTATRVDGDGHTLLWWRFDWQQDDLASVCASHGADAKMVIEHRMQGPGTTNALPACTNAEVMGHGDHACAMAGLVRLEVDCMAGHVLFEATKDWDIVHWGGPGYYHIESTAYPLLTRRLMMVDPTCGRLLHPRFVPMAPAGSPEVGVDTASTSAHASMLGWNDPYENGQLCRSGTDCRAGHACFFDEPVSDCQSTPLGRCVPYESSNTCALSHTCGWCLVLFGTTCTAFPGHSCALIGCGAACVSPVDAGTDSR